MVANDQRPVQPALLADALGSPAGFLVCPASFYLARREYTAGWGGGGFAVGFVVGVETLNCALAPGVVTRR